MRILIIEDEPKLAAAIRDSLVAEHYDAVIAPSGEDGFFLVSAERFDLILLDWMLPGRDGLEVLRVLRKRGVSTPVLLLTARDAIEDRVLGLDSGADDYLVKPFAFPELHARLRTLLRRGQTEAATTLNLADLELNRVTREAHRAGIDLALTAREFDLLAYLLSHTGQVVSREMLARDVWQETERATPLDNVIDVHIAQLRRKLDVHGGISLLHTVRGVGFILRVEDSP